MLKLKEIQTKPVIYQGLEIDVPAGTNFMWLRHNAHKTVLWASSKKPVWHNEHNLYIPPSDAAPVAELEHADLTVEQVKDSLESDESLPTAQDLEQLAVVENLIKNLHGFASSLERNVVKAKLNPSSENIQALIQHVYASEGELDTLIEHIIDEAEYCGIDTGVEYPKEDTDADTADEEYAEIVKELISIFK